MAAPMNFVILLHKTAQRASLLGSRWMSYAVTPVIRCAQSKDISYVTRTFKYSSVRNCDHSTKFGKFSRNFSSTNRHFRWSKQRYCDNILLKNVDRRTVKPFQTYAPLQHGDFEWQDPKSEDEIVNLTYVLPDGEEVKVRGKVGDNAMYLAHRHNIPLEGACEASLACCTCHVYVADDFVDLIQEPLEEEEDMLDMAPFLQENSRLGCQITLSKEMEGLVLRLPQATRNFYVDGHTPEPH